MLRTTSACIFTWALAACGPTVAAEESADDPGCDPWAEVCEVSLRPSWDVHSILDLELAQVIEEPREGTPEALGDGHVRASIGRYLALQSNLDDPGICVLPDAFAEVGDVPTDPSVCDCRALKGCWGSSTLFGLFGTPATESDAGILLRTSDGELYRGRVLVADSETTPTTLTIEYKGVM
ncbi:MAG: hypothetical protein KUG77_25820 [Nannocystaceae bacterium]|nr:hypothetical protein [Nannocystaceae bacterium]